MLEDRNTVASIAAAIPQPLAIMHAVRDDDGTILDFEWDFINAAGAREILVAPEELVGQRLLEKLPEHRDGLFGTYCQVTETGEPFEIVEAGYDDTWGTQEVIPRIYDIRAEKLDDGFVVWWNDVTDRVIARTELEHSNKELELFTYAASHDLQAPLRQITSALTLMTDEVGELPEVVQEYMDIATESAIRAQQLIRALLEYSRVDARTRALKPVSLESALQDALLDLEQPIAESAAEIDVDIESVPRVMGEPTLIRQLLANLIGNAIKYRRADVSPRVRVDWRPMESEFVEILVTDNGIGVDEQFTEAVFELFRRLHPNSEYSGTGLGLAMVKKIVESFGGRIRLTSEGEGMGSVVRFTLPIEQKEGSDG